MVNKLKKGENIKEIKFKTKKMVSVRRYERARRAIWKQLLFIQWEAKLYRCFALRNYLKK